MRNCFLIILLILTTSCVVENVQSDFDITKAIPVNSDLIIKIHDINKINESIKKIGKNFGLDESEMNECLKN